MDEISLAKCGPLVRFFEKEAEWLGLPRNRGLVLTALYLNKYMSNKMLSVDDICNITNYSRSNVGVILTQLEDLGIVLGHPDISNGGRGRRKIVYSIDQKFDSLSNLGFKRTAGKLEEFIVSIGTLFDQYQNENLYIKKMMTDFKKDTMKTLANVKKGLE